MVMNHESSLPYPDRKISETLLEFAAPMLEAAGGSKRRFEEALRIAFTSWNAVVYADVRGDDKFLDQMRNLPANMLGVSSLVEGLIERKRTLFGDDHRLIGKYEVTRTEDGFNVRAEARDPRTSGDRQG